jgi:hypothetical protein
LAMDKIRSKKRWRCHLVRMTYLPLSIMVTTVVLTHPADLPGGDFLFLDFSVACATALPPEIFFKLTFTLSCISCVVGRLQRMIHATSKK